jgi:hypothetical protein
MRAVLIASAAVGIFGCGDYPIVGTWIGCAQSPPADNCQSIQANGIRYTSDGRVITLHPTNAPSQIFSRNTTGLVFSYVTTQGTYKVNGDRLDYRLTCGATGSVNLIEHDGFVEFANLPPAQQGSQYLFHYDTNGAAP